MERRRISKHPDSDGKPLGTKNNRIKTGERKMKTIKKQLISLTIFSGVLAIAFFAAGFISVKADNGDDGCDRDCQRDLARARAATAQYHNVDKALADGFINTRQCVEVPGLGAMGIHFVRPDRIGNPALDVEQPETLLYLPDKHGRLRLIGIEYVVPGSMSSNPPVLFGQQFHFNNQRNEWALHVWIWQHNPSGMFADFNPKLSCPR